MDISISTCSYALSAMLARPFERCLCLLARARCVMFATPQAPTVCNLGAVWFLPAYESTAILFGCLGFCSMCCQIDLAALKPPVGVTLWVTGLCAAPRINPRCER
jgi:hypothetical protein